MSELKTAVVTGAGTGVGRAAVIALARKGWKVVLAGRTESTLEEARAAAGLDPEQGWVIPCNVGEVSEVQRMAEQALKHLGAVEVLVNAAGTNTPRRALHELSLEDYHRLIDTNLHGSYYAAQAFLPSMRERRSGTIVNVVSDSALWGMPLAGAAYTISKAGQRGFTQTINAEEGANGIRAISILPGEIDTPILRFRPTMPSDEHRATMLQPEDVAECITFAIELPEPRGNSRAASAASALAADLTRSAERSALLGVH